MLVQMLKAERKQLPDHGSCQEFPAIDQDPQLSVSNYSSARLPGSREGGAQYDFASLLTTA